MAMPNPYGSGTFLGASYFDHSCNPNATTVFESGQLKVVATKDIPDISQVCTIVTQFYLSKYPPIRLMVVSIGEQALWS